MDTSCAPPTTDDRLLGGRVLLRQPAAGYRAAIDPLLLAASVPAQPGERVADFGCGPGAAMLALAARVQGLAVTGFEIEPAIADLARHNVAANGKGSEIAVVTADVAAAPPGQFDHVLMNPPFHAAPTHQAPPDAVKARAHRAAAGETARWIAAGLRALRSGGSLTVIQTAERLPEILAALGPAGRVVVLPLVPKEGAAASRVIVQGIKGRRTPFRLLSPLVLHGADGRFTAAVEPVLRDAVALPLA